MTKEDRAHALGDEFRESAREFRRQFVNWIAIASAGGIGLLMSFVAASPQKASALQMLLPSLVVWLVSVVCAGGTLFGMIYEADSAAAMFHRQGRRERQKQIAQIGRDPGVTRQANDRADEHHERADFHHHRSRMWLQISNSLLLMGAVCFLFGATYPVYLFATQNLLKGVEDCYVPLPK